MVWASLVLVFALGFGVDVGLAPFPPDAPPWFCPMKVLDYRAQGTPVVGTNVGETQLLVGEGGTIVDPGDVQSMIDATRYWIGRRTTPRLRSWQRVGNQMIEATLSGRQAEETR